MSRRRLQIICSSDEEEDELEPSRTPNPNPNPNDIEMEILESSTTGLQSVTLNSSTSSPHTDPNLHNEEPMNVGVSEAADCGIGRVLEGLGLRLRKEWLESCVRGLEGSVREFSRLDDTAKAKQCFEQLLYADMNCCGAGMLPRDVHKLHLVDLKGPFVLQVDEIVNISCPLRDRYQKAAAGIKRCLKLSMTDGIQRVFGMEYRSIKELEVLAPSGMKVVICNVHVRHGILMLVPEVIEVLGGMVEELEGARQRLVNEINKPPRGKRTRSGVVPPLATRATHAAWPQEGVSAPESAGTSTRERTMPFQVHELGTSSGFPATETEETHPNTRENAEPSLPSAVTITPPVHTRASNPGFPSTSSVSIPSSNMMDAWPGFSSDATMVDMTTEDIDFPIRVESNELINLTSSTMDEEEELLTDVRTGPTTPVSGRTTESFPVSSTMVPDEDAELDSLATAIDVEGIRSVYELEPAFLLSGEKENPFTYLSSLSAKMHGSASTVSGKIKCFLTGVKGFQYRQRSTYELRAFIDDGSFISEILIDHDVVQKEIGFSPAEVTAALTCSDGKRVSDMKETMKNFQKFLENFEGTMLLQMNNEWPVPVAIEMNQGCRVSDAWLLLKRLKPSTFSQPNHLHHLETISLPP